MIRSPPLEFNASLLCPVPVSNLARQGPTRVIWEILVYQPDASQSGVKMDKSDTRTGHAGTQFSDAKK